MYDYLKALIRRTETGKVQYETIIGHNQRHLDKPVTQMTVDEIIAASDSWRKRFGTTSGAAGAYQIIKPTLVQLKKDLGLTGTEKFTPALQDRMCDKLLEKRGIKAFLARDISVTAFGNNLAREWASFPVLTATTRGGHKIAVGQSYYAGHAGNAALIKPNLVITTLRQQLALGAQADTPVLEPPPLPDAPIDVTPVEADRGRFPLGAVLVLFILAALAIWYFFLR